MVMMVMVMEWLIGSRDIGIIWGGIHAESNWHPLITP